jgi:hypothetical protein
MVEYLLDSIANFLFGIMLPICIIFLVGLIESEVRKPPVVNGNTILKLGYTCKVPAIIAWVFFCYIMVLLLFDCDSILSRVFSILAVLFATFVLWVIYSQKIIYNDESITMTEFWPFIKRSIAIKEIEKYEDEADKVLIYSRNGKTIKVYKFMPGWRRFVRDIIGILDENVKEKPSQGQRLY